MSKVRFTGFVMLLTPRPFMDQLLQRLVREWVILDMAIINVKKAERDSIHIYLIFDEFVLENCKTELMGAISMC